MSIVYVIVLLLYATFSVILQETVCILPAKLQAKKNVSFKISNSMAVKVRR